MFPLSQINLTAGGNITECRFLTTVSGNGNFRKAIQAVSSTALILGVSERGTRGPARDVDGTTYLCIAGDPIPYRGPLQVASLMLGGTVSDMGVPLTSDASGRGIAQAPADGTTTYYGAIALQPGIVGDIADVYVLPTVVVA